MSEINFKVSELARFKKAELRVLIALFEKLEDGNRVWVGQGQLAEELEVPRSYVSNAIQHLKRRGAITKSTKAETGWWYELNPTLVWKGSLEGHEKAVERHQRMKAARITGVIGSKKGKQAPE